MQRLALVLLLAAPLAAVAAPEVEACVAASAQGQQLQKQGSLFAARRELERCADAACPGIVRAECTRWLEQVLEAMPSIIVVVRVDGVDQPPTRVLIDGQPAPAPVSGKPWDLDPGEHRVRVELGERTQEQRLIVNVGEKNRRVIFQLALPEVAMAAARPPPVLPLVATGVTVLGASLFTGLGLSGRARLSAILSNECSTAKTCSPTAVADIQRRFIAADVSLAVGVVAALAAAWQWWAWTREPGGAATEAAVSVGPGSGGASVLISGRF